MSKLKMMPSQTEAEDVVMGILIRNAQLLDDVQEMINQKTLYSSANKELLKIAPLFNDLLQPDLLGENRIIRDL